MRERVEGAHVSAGCSHQAVATGAPFSLFCVRWVCAPLALSLGSTCYRVVA